MLRTTIYTDPTAGLTAQTGGLKTGPDGKIYFRYNIAMQKVHSIDNPNAAGALCNFKLNVLTLDAGAINAYQFPVTCEYEDTLSSIAAVGATTFCNGDSVRLEAKGGKRYVWSNGQIGSFISVKNTGTYYVFTTFPSGCVHTSNTIKIKANIPAKADAGADKTVACGSTTDLMAIAPANGSYSYQWLGGPAAQNYPNVGAGTYVLVMTDNASSCQSFDTVIVENTRQSFSISGLPTDTFVCKNNTISLTANIQGSGTYTHSWIDDKGNTYPDTANLTAVITQNTVFTYRVSDGICSDSRNINVSLADAKGTLTVNSSTTLCKGDSVQLIAPAGGTYLWNNGETTREILVGQQGNYYCTRTVGTCQANTDTISITDASFSATLMVSNNRVKENESITFTGSNSSYIYDWDFGDTTKATGFSVNHTYSTEGTYIATATVSNGTCSMQIQNVITVGNPAGNTTELNLYLPTGFITSGGTDYYQALPIGASEFNMFIFNRWGMAVFYTNTVLYQWDGKDLKGNECPDGIYAVLAQVKNTQGATVNKTGTVYLLRK